jgi:glycosyltransferase involved in cell wall biosynthesis
MGVEHAIDSIGPVAKSEIPDLLAAADVESHEQGDGLGTATLEAMAAGVPVVGWGRVDNFPGVPLYDGHDIYLAQRGDVDGLAERLIGALTDGEAARAVGRRARAVVEEHFDLSRVLEQHLECLADLVEHRKGS